jgi:hypothetical protein
MSANVDPNIPSKPAVPHPEKAEAVAALAGAEKERLHELIRQLEKERVRDHQTIASLQKERDAYRRAAYAWALEQITDEDLQRYAQNDDGVSYDDLIEELKASNKASRDA